MSRVLAYGVGMGLTLAVLSKAFGDPVANDSYPLSTYPMFARARGKPLLHFMEGVSTSGNIVRLEPNLIANQEVMQAAATVRRAVQRGERTMSRLCERVAENVQRSNAHTSVTEVRIVAARFDPLEYFSLGPVPESRKEQFRCSVPRRK